MDIYRPFIQRADNRYTSVYHGIAHLMYPACGYSRDILWHCITRGRASPIRNGYLIIPRGWWAWLHRDISVSAVFI